MKSLFSFSEKVARLFNESAPGNLSASLHNPFGMMTQIPRVHELLPYESYCEESRLFYNQGSTGFVLRGAPLVGASLEDQGRIASFFSNETDLPEGCSLQILLIASPKIEPLLDYWLSFRVNASLDSSARRIQFLKERALEEKNGNLVRDYRILISYTLPGHKETLLEKTALLQTRETLQKALEGIGMKTEIMNSSDLIQEVGNILNFEPTSTPDKRTLRPLDSLSYQIVDTDMSYFVKEEGVYLKEGAYLSKSYVPKSAPSHWALGHMDHFLGDLIGGVDKIPCPYLIHYGLHVMPNQGAQKRGAYAKSESLQNSFKNNISKWMAGLEEEYEEIKGVIHQIQRGDRIVLSNINYTIFSKPQNLSTVEQALKSIWQKAGWDFQSTRYDHFGVLLSSLPMMWTASEKKKLTWRGRKREIQGAAAALNSLGRLRKTITKESQNMLPLVGEWKGQITPGMPLLGRRGQLFFWSPFDGKLIPNKRYPGLADSYNVCISGTMGSGKSFFCNEMIQTTLDVGGKAFVLDKGESFKNLCERRRGHRVIFDVSSDMSLNPFTHIPLGMEDEDQDARLDQLSALEAMVLSMALPTQKPDSLQKTYIQEAIKNVWESKKNQGDIDSIREWLLSHKDSRANDLGQMLWAYSSAGIYGNYFNPPATLNLNHDFVVIETQNLTDDLRAVVVQMMIVQVWQRMVKSGRETPFLILIDEAWELIQGQSSDVFIGKVARTARKYRGSLVLATQNLTDYFREESPGARVAFENADWRCILKQSGTVTDSLKTHPSLRGFFNTDYKENLIRSLQPARGFSEIAIFGSQVDGVVGRLYCDPKTVLTYSSDAQDFADINRYKQKGLSTDQAIDAVLKEREEAAALGKEKIQ